MVEFDRKIIRDRVIQNQEKGEAVSVLDLSFALAGFSDRHDARSVLARSP